MRDFSQPLGASRIEKKVIRFSMLSPKHLDFKLLFGAKAFMKKDTQNPDFTTAFAP
jgi:hypothetical protein